MFENASQVVPEDSLERKRIQSQRDFEPLLDTDEAASFSGCIPERSGQRHAAVQSQRCKLENDGVFAPPRWIFGSRNSPAERLDVEKEK